MKFPLAPIWPGPDTLSGFPNKAYLHPHNQTEGEAARVSCREQHLLKTISPSADMLALDLLLNSSLSVVERVVPRGRSASKAFISSSTSVILREKMKWASGWQSSQTTDEIWQVLLLYNNECTLEEENGWMAGTSQPPNTIYTINYRECT